MLAVTMSPFRLRFQVPDARQAELRRALATGSGRSARISTVYYDTQDRRIAAAGLCLYVRREDRREPSQTIACGRGWRDTLPRHEAQLPAGADRAAAPDLARHAGTAAGRALRSALADEPAAALRAVAQIDATRRGRRLRSGSSSACIALEIGLLRSGDDEWPVCVVEMALLDGSIGDLLSLARRWVARHGLWLDVRAPFERATAAPPTGAAQPRLDRAMSADAALRAMVASCLDQVLPNAAEVADRAAPVHLHQARVGLRRLRSALRSFGDWSDGVTADWPDRLGQLFTQLGQTRDRDVLLDMQPRLRTAGMPEFTLPAAPEEDIARDAVRGVESTTLWLELLGFATGAAKPAAPRARGLTRRARTRLARLHRRLSEDARIFAALDDSERHRLRKRLKRLRYGVELTASLFPPRPVRQLLDRMKPAQELLGQYNDILLAQLRYQCAAQTDARAWFAVGWLAASRSHLLLDAARALRGLPAAPKFLEHPR